MPYASRLIEEDQRRVHERAPAAYTFPLLRIGTSATLACGVGASAAEPARRRCTCLSCTGSAKTYGVTVTLLSLQPGPVIWCIFTLLPIVLGQAAVLVAAKVAPDTSMSIWSALSSTTIWP